MTRATTVDLQRDLATYLRRVEAGETVLIVENNRAVAELRPALTAADGERPFGLAASDFSVPDDFDAPLPQDILDDFEDATAPGSVSSTSTQTASDRQPRH